MNATWQEHERTWMQHERSMKGHECNMKGTWKDMKAKWKDIDVCWPSNEDAFITTESWHIHISSTESPPPEKTIRAKKDNVTSGQCNWYVSFLHYPIWHLRWCQTLSDKLRCKTSLFFGAPSSAGSFRPYFALWDPDTLSWRYPEDGYHDVAGWFRRQTP